MSSGESEKTGTAKQLGLTIRPKLAYTGENFVLHSGVKGIVDDLLPLFNRKFYPLISIVGEPRSGKSHLSIYLTQQLVGLGKEVHLSEGETFLTETVHSEAGAGSDRVIIIDDADTYLSLLTPGQSGKLVQLIEELRVSGGHLVLLRTKKLEEYSFDEHLMSRFSSGYEFFIGEPEREEIRDLVSAIAYQRGIKLSEKKLEYLHLRLPANIGEIEEYMERVALLSKESGKPFTFPLLGDALR